MNSQYFWFKPQNEKCLMLLLRLFSDLMIGWFIVFNTTFNNISVISWRSVLVVEKIRVPGENHQPVASHWQTLSHYVVLSTHHLSRIRTHNVSGNSTDCIGSWKSDYHTITTKTATWFDEWIFFSDWWYMIYIEYFMFSGVLEEAKFYGFNSMIGHLEEYIEVSFLYL